MSKIKQRAAEARALLSDPVFCAICTEIEEGARVAFLNSGGDPEAMAAAYRQVEAVSTFRDAIQARLSDEAVEDKREQRRERHD